MSTTSDTSGDEERPFQGRIEIDLIRGAALRALPPAITCHAFGVKNGRPAPIVLKNWIREEGFRIETKSSRGHVGFVDVKVSVNFLHIVVIFHGFHQAQHLLGTTAFELDIGLRDH